jgi:hypothetical protein
MSQTTQFPLAMHQSSAEFIMTVLYEATVSYRVSYCSQHQFNYRKIQLNEHLHLYKRCV